MGGLALILGKGPPPKGGGPMPNDKAPPSSPDDEAAEGESGGDEKQYAKLVVDAIKDGDDAGAADALVELVKACNKY